MSGGMDVDRFQNDEPPAIPDASAAAKKIIMKEALLGMKETVDARVLELRTELLPLMEKQKTINDMLTKIG